MTQFIFVIGASGTGKSTISEEMEVIIRAKKLSVATLNLDHYYLPASKVVHSPTKNFDVPEALEQDLVKLHLKALEKGETIFRPTYNMKISDRVIDGEFEFPAQDVVIVEGIFAGEYIDFLEKSTSKFKVYVQSLHVPDNYTRKEERDTVEREKSEVQMRINKRNQLACLYTYVAPHMNTADIIIENTWQPAPDSDTSSSVDTKVPMVINDKLVKLEKFLSASPTSTEGVSAYTRAASFFAINDTVSFQPTKDACDSGVKSSYS